MVRPRCHPSDERTSEELSHEQAMGEVSDVMVNLEHAIDRARQALKRVSKAGDQPNIQLALADLTKDLDRIRRRLTKDTYFADDTYRLL